MTSELLGDFTVHPKGMGQDGKALGKMDVILLACKGNGLAKACHDMAPMVATHTVVVPLLNGVLVSDLMEPLLPPCFIADGTIRVFSHLEKPGHVVQTAGSGQVVMGMKDGRDLPLLHELAGLLRKSGIPAKVTDHIRLDSWKNMPSWQQTVPFSAFLTALQEKCGARRTIDRWWQKQWKK